MLNIINFILRPLHLHVLKKRMYDMLERENDILNSLARIYSQPGARMHHDHAACIIFSMDRGPQLHALLCSYFEKVNHPVPVHILYRTSSPAHQKAYEEVFSIFEGRQLTIIAQQGRESFKSQLSVILQSINTEKIFFLADDDLFIEDVDMLDFIKYDTRTTVATLRMGANLRRAYTVQKDQKLPVFIEQDVRDDGKLYWLWENGEFDWGYPLSVDGHLFSTAEMLVLVKHTDFNSPNTFESNLQAYTKYFRYRYGICYKKSRILNIPINKVQNDIENIHGAVHQDYLLEQWNCGMQMDYRSLFGFVNESAHQEVPIRFIRRT